MVLDSFVASATISWFLFKVLSDWTLPGTTTVSAVALGNNQNQNHNNVVPQNNHISNNIHSNSNQSHIKPQNRTPGEGTCYEIGMCADLTQCPPEILL